MQAACGLAQLEKAPEFIARRRENFKYLYERLKRLEDLLLLPKATPHSDPSWFGFPLTLKADAPITRVALTQFLDDRKIGTRLLFAGNLTRQPYMKGLNYRISGSLEVTDIVMNQTFWVGVQPSLTHDMLDYVADSIALGLGR